MCGARHQVFKEVEYSIDQDQDEQAPRNNLETAPCTHRRLRSAALVMTCKILSKSSWWMSARSWLSRPVPLIPGGSPRFSLRSLYFLRSLRSTSPHVSQLNFPLNSFIPSLIVSFICTTNSIAAFKIPFLPFYNPVPTIQ